jgi:hypothetical protein
MSEMPTSVCQLPSPLILRVPSAIAYETRIPAVAHILVRGGRKWQARHVPVMASWYVAVSVPRICGGAVSAWYVGTAALSPPTPRPATSRPTANCAQDVLAAIWMMTPTMKTRASICIARRRPRRSPKGAPRSAPRSVPMERSATMAPERTRVKEQEAASPGVVQVPKAVRKESCGGA